MIVPRCSSVPQDNSSASVNIYGNSNQYTLPYATLAVWDNAGNLGDAVIAASGTGAVGLGTSSPMAQVDIMDNTYVSGSSMDYLFHIGGKAGDFVSVTNQGYMGVGQLNWGVADVEISDISGLGTQLIADDGDPHNPYFVVEGNNVGIGMWPELGNTLAIKGPGSNAGTTVCLYQSGDGTGYDEGIRFKSSGTGYTRHLITDDYASNNLIIAPGLGGGANRVVQVLGSVVIGANPAPTSLGSGTFASALLSVDGQLAAKEIVVTTTGWSDTVFSNSYQLKSLDEVKNYITQNHHLPDVPSEKDVIKDGISLGEMNKILLQKVEELTLYVMKQQKEIDELKIK